MHQCTLDIIVENPYIAIQNQEEHHPVRLLSDACEYGLRAVVWLAQRPQRPQKVREIAEGTRSAPGYLVKVLQALTKAGILSAQRGSQGGFTLERDPADLSVLEVLNAIDPIDPIERINTCPLELEAHHHHLCPVHQRIDDALAAVERTFGDSRIADMLPTEAGPLQTCRTLLVHDDAETPSCSQTCRSISLIEEGVDNA